MSVHSPAALARSGACSLHSYFLTLNSSMGFEVGSFSLRSTPAVAAENSGHVLPWRSTRLASESRSRPHPHHHPLSEHPQLIPAAVVEHSAIEQTQEANGAALKVDHSQSDKSQDCRALLLQ